MVKELIRSFLTAVCLHRLFRFFNKNRFIVITYHGIVSSPVNPFNWSILPLANFSWQIKYLKSCFNILPLDVLITKIIAGQPLPKNTAAVTFDDGFENVFVTAFPLLKAQRIPATIFITTNYIDTKKILWPEELYLLFKKTKEQRLDLRNIGLKNHDLQTIYLRENAYLETVEHLKKLRPEERLIQLNNIREKTRIEKLDESDKKNFLMLSREQINKMFSSSLISFGAHTANHEILSHLDEDEQQKEIHLSCRTIKSLSGSKVIFFAYPNGGKNDYNETTVNILKKENVICALTNIEGLNSKDDNLYGLKRINVDGRTTKSQFKLVTSGFHAAIKYFFNMLCSKN